MRLCGQERLPRPRWEVVDLFLERILRLKYVGALERPIKTFVVRLRSLNIPTLDDSVSRDSHHSARGGRSYRFCCRRILPFDQARVLIQAGIRLLEEGVDDIDHALPLNLNVVHILQGSCSLASKLGS